VGEEEEGGGQTGHRTTAEGWGCYVGGMARMGEGEVTALGSPPPPSCPRSDTGESGSLTPMWNDSFK
jgi:hypothetical protein